MVMQKLSREERAKQLIANGAVTLRPGTGTALVRGSNGEEYVVTKTSCSCHDFLNRGGDCKHRISTRILCQMYRACAKQARETGRVTIPPALMRALGGYRDVEAPTLRLPAELVAAIGAPEPPPCPAHVPAGALVDERGVPYCARCGHDLVNGRCPRHDARLRELGYLTEAA